MLFDYKNKRKHDYVKYYKESFTLNLQLYHVNLKLCNILHCHVSFCSYNQLAFCVHYIFNSVLCNLN